MQVTDHSVDGTGITPVRVVNLTQLSEGAPWRIALPHARDRHLIIMLTRGQGRALINGVRRGLGAGNVLWLPAGTQFALETGPQVYGQVLTIAADTAAPFPKGAQHLRVRDAHLQGELTALTDSLHRDIQSGRAFQHEAQTARLSLIAVWLRRAVVESAEGTDRVSAATPETPSAAHRLSARFAALVEARFDQGLPMSSYAEALGVTPTHLTRSCKVAAGMTAADLLTARVLHEARRLLADSPYPAQNIARHLGFRSAAYFSRFILKHTGAPPSAQRG